MSQIDQDGYTTGQLSGLNIDSEGVIAARFTNGQNQVLGQIALAHFANVQGLHAIGDTAWVETNSSGAPVIGAPGSGSLGADHVGCARGFERRAIRPARAVDHRAAELPGERPDDFHRRRDHQDHHQHLTDGEGTGDVDKLIYVAMTGAAHIDRAQTLHSNNLANVGTTGFAPTSLRRVRCSCTARDTTAASMR